MVGKTFVLTVTSFLLIFISGCSLQRGLVLDNGMGQDPTSAINTRVAEIIVSTDAAQTLIANSVASTLDAMVTNTPEISNTPTSYLPSTPLSTLPSSIPMLRVSVQTNCRSGPGTSFDILGILNVGQSAQVVGRSTYNDNWIIKLPSNPDVTCWLWGQYASVVGDISNLPAVNPPPTPTPTANFTVEYTATVFCAAHYAFRFEIKNNGSLTWQSIWITITDNTTLAVFIHYLDSFRSYNGCPLEADQQDLMPGESGPVTNDNPGQLGYNPSGHSFTAIFRLCSENGGAGTCLEKTLSFNP